MSKMYLFTWHVCTFIQLFCQVPVRINTFAAPVTSHGVVMLCVWLTQHTTHIALTRSKLDECSQFFKSLTTLRTISTVTPSFVLDMITLQLLAGLLMMQWLHSCSAQLVGPQIQLASKSCMILCRLFKLHVRTHVGKSIFLIHGRFCGQNKRPSGVQSCKLFCWRHSYVMNECAIDISHSGWHQNIYERIRRHYEKARGKAFSSGIAGTSTSNADER